MGGGGDNNGRNGRRGRRGGAAGGGAGGARGDRGRMVERVAERVVRMFMNDEAREGGIDENEFSDSNSELDSDEDNSTSGASLIEALNNSNDDGWETTEE